MVHKEDEDEKKIPSVVVVSPPTNNAEEEEMKQLLRRRPPHSSNLHQQQEQKQETKNQNDDDDPTAHSCPRTECFNQWIPLTSFGGRNPTLLPPFTFWVRPLCCHKTKGCDFDDIVFVDKICFPEDPEHTVEYCCKKMCFSSRSHGFAVVKDNRTEKQKWKNTMTNPRKSSSSSSFGSAISCFFGAFSSSSKKDEEEEDDDASIPQEERIPTSNEKQNKNNYNPDEIPLPPKPSQCTIVAYSLVKIQKSDRCDLALTNPMCRLQQRRSKNNNLCLDLQSVAVTPAFRKRGLAEYVIRKSVQKAWNVANGLKRKWRMMKKEDAERDYKEYFGEAVGNKEDDGGDCSDDEYICSLEDEDAEVGEDGATKKQQPQHHHYDVCNKSNLDDDDEVPSLAIEDNSNNKALHVTLCVRRGNERATNLYKKLGFVFEETKVELFYADRTPMDRMGTWVDFSFKTTF